MPLNFHVIFQDIPKKIKPNPGFVELLNINQADSVYWPQTNKSIEITKDMLIRLS